MPESKSIPRLWDGERLNDESLSEIVGSVTRAQVVGSTSALLLNHQSAADGGRDPRASSGKDEIAMIAAMPF